MQQELQERLPLCDGKFIEIQPTRAKPFDGREVDRLNTPQRSYFEIAVNPHGAIRDESTDVTIVERATLPVLWNPGTKAVVQKDADRWTVEIMIPLKDCGDIGPSETYPRGLQVGRTGFTGGQPEAWSLSPTGGPYATLNRWANLWIRPG